MKNYMHMDKHNRKKIILIYGVFTDNDRDCKSPELTHESGKKHLIYHFLTRYSSNFKNPSTNERAEEIWELLKLKCVSTTLIFVELSIDAGIFVTFGRSNVIFESKIGFQNLVLFQWRVL